MTRRSDHNERGTVVVESAIIISLIVVLFFGILEFGMLLRSSQALTEASRTGARAAASLPREVGYQDVVAEAVAASLRGSIPAGAVLDLVVYKADPITGQPVVGTLPACGTCYRFTWDPVDEEFDTSAGSSWPASSQSACGPVDMTDYVGVWVSGEYDFVTTFWSDRVDLSNYTVMRLEPITGTAVCS